MWTLIGCIVCYLLGLAVGIVAVCLCYTAKGE